MKMRIVGVQRLSGEKSKKSGKPYDFCILHCLSCDKEWVENEKFMMHGYRVDSIIVDTSLALDLPVPCLADVYSDRFGRVEDIRVHEFFETV